LFIIDGKFDRDGNDIPESMLIKVEVPRFIQIPNQQHRDLERFDPIVHLELEEPMKEEDEERDPNEEEPE